MPKYETENRVCDICGCERSKDLWTQQPHSRCIMIRQEDGTPVHDKNVMCTNCGLIYKPETMTRESLNRFYSEDYGKLYKQDTDEFISKSRICYNVEICVCALDWLRKSGIEISGKTWLDIGAGDGMFVRALQSLGADAYGTEVSDSSAKVCRKLNCIDLVPGDITQGIVMPTLFDVVCIRNVIEHVYSAKEFLNVAKEMINENGYLLIEVPSADRPYVGQPPDSFLSAAHIFTYTADSIKELARQCGLYVHKLSYSGHKNCMLILLKKGKQSTMSTNNHALLYKKLKEMYGECSKTFFNFQQKIIELFGISDVNIIIRELKEHKYTSNFIAFALLNQLIQRLDKRNIMEQIINRFEWDYSQPGDINTCPASLLFFDGMIRKENGDFRGAYERLKNAMDMYPQFMSYNFVKELKMEGVLSDTVLNEYLWFNCLRQLKSME